MAISIINSPILINPIYTIDGHNLSIVVDSTDSSNLNFKYVQRIEVDGLFVAQTRVSPNVELGMGKGVLQPHRIIEDFISYDIHEQFAGFQICTNSMVEWSSRIGEESDGTLDGTGASYSITFGPTVSGFAWNGTYQYGDDYDFTDFRITSTTSNRRFLTNAPNEQDIYFNESSFLYFMNGVDYIFASSSTSPDIVLEIVVYLDGIPTTYYAIPTIDIPINKICSVGVGPSDINKMCALDMVVTPQGSVVNSRIIFCGIDYYTVRLTDLDFGDIDPDPGED